MDVSGFTQSQQIEDQRDHQPGVMDKVKNFGYELSAGARTIGKKVGLVNDRPEQGLEPMAVDAGYNAVGSHTEPQKYSDDDRQEALDVVDKALSAGRQEMTGSGSDQQQHFAEGGAVGDDEGESWSPPAEGGYQPDPTGPTQEQAGLAGDQLKPAAEGAFDQGAQGKMKRFMAYLTGADAAAPEEVQAAEKEVDPDGTMDPADRKLATIKAAAEGDGGEKNGFRYIQHYRQKYDAFKAHAAAAITAGDLENAAKSATEAYTNLPDGYDIKFTAAKDKGLINATMSENGKLVKQITISPEKMTTFLRGPDSQFDALLSKGGINVINSLAAPSQAPQSARTFAGAGTAGSAALAARTPAPQAGAERTLDTTAGIEAQAKRIFPSVGESQQREKWIATQLATQGEQRAALATARAGNETKERIATGNNATSIANTQTKSESYANRYAVQAKDHLDQIKAKAEAAARTGTGDAKERARIAVAAINAAVLGGDPDKMIELARRFGFDASGAPQQQAPAATGQQGPPPAGMKIQWNKTHTQWRPAQ